MQRMEAASVGWKLRVFDTLAVALLFLLTLGFRESIPLWWHYDLVPSNGPTLKDVSFANQLHLMPVVVAGWVFALNNALIYKEFRRIRSDVLLLRLMRASFVALGVVMAADFLVHFENRLSRTFLLTYFGISTFGLWAARRLMLRWKIMWNQDPMNILAIGSAEEAEPFLEILQRHASWGLRIVGVLYPDEQLCRSQMGGVPVLGKLSALPTILAERNIGQVFMTGRAWDNATLRFVADTCEEVGVSFSMDANFLGLGISRAEVQDYEGWSVLSFTTTPQDSEAMAIKRVIDIAGALVGLTITGLLMIVVAPLIKLDGGPVFFSQVRSGLYGRPFYMHKFRSMRVDAEARKAELEAKNEMGDQRSFKMTNDPRVTPIGRFIRKFSIDEFPQFWNVLVGEMSLVGARPPIPAEVKVYERWQMRRLSMKPGLTCIWQVKGRNKIGFDEWMKLDLEYIDNWSLFLDIKLILLTVPAVILARGAK